MTQKSVFGYGSLVQQLTHDYQPKLTGQITGWQRAWRFTPARDISFLTVIPCPGAVIDGLICGVPNQSWAALDQREAAYDRHSITPTFTGAAPDWDVVLYVVPQDTLNEPDDAHPILLSYLDVVVSGYLDMFGSDGLERFVQTTVGWEAPILNDRAAPRYPRALDHSSDVLAATDAIMAQVGSKIVT